MRWLSHRLSLLAVMCKRGATIATLRSSQSAEITLTLAESQWRQLPEKLEASQAIIRSVSNSEVSWSGIAKRLSSTVDPVTRQRALVIAVDHPLEQKEPLLFGSFVSAEIQGRAQDDLLSIPAFSLTAEGEIWLVENNQLVRRKVKPVFSDDGQLFISQQDLPEQVQLVRHPMASYLPGMTVNTRHFSDLNQVAGGQQ